MAVQAFTAASLSTLSAQATVSARDHHDISDFQTEARTESWQYFDADTWTSGFFTSQLYALHDRDSLCRFQNTSDSVDWLNLANEWNRQQYVDEVTQLTNTHDVGFLSFPLQNEYAINALSSTRDYILEMADHLAARFNPRVGCTRSWDQGGPNDFEVVSIIARKAILARADCTYRLSTSA